MNYRLIATEIGDAVKYDTTLKEIDRLALALFRFDCQAFPNSAISSVRAQRIYDWIMTLGRQQLEPEKRMKLLVEFSRKLVPDERRGTIDRILKDSGAPESLLNQENLSLFTERGLHPVVHQHARKLFAQGNFFHAVFEAIKAYHNLVREKSHLTSDGHGLMLHAWSPDKGTLKVTPCVSETDKNVQVGIGHLSAGLMSAVRNPTAHEPANQWPISRADALDLLSFISFLLRQYDAAVYVPAAKP